MGGKLHFLGLPEGGSVSTTRDTWHFCLFWYRSNHPHTSSDSVSPVCRIFYWHPLKSNVISWLCFWALLFHWIGPWLIPVFQYKTGTAPSFKSAYFTVVALHSTLKQAVSVPVPVPVPDPVPPWEKGRCPTVGWLEVHRGHITTAWRGKGGARS